MSIPNAQPKLLPATIEGATARYLHNYQKYFEGPREEMERLKGFAEARLRKLRRKAPTFYENKLYKMVNQAASDLLICETKTKQGAKDFNEIHQQFLRVLDALMKGQPSGDIDFQTEKDRARKREELIKEQLNLIEERNKLQAEEFDVDDLGDDEASGSKYVENLTRLTKVESELKRVSILVAAMEGVQIEPEITFELRVPQTSTIRRCLNDEQLKELERLILEFIKRKAKRLTIVDKTVIDEILGLLKLDTTKYTKDEINDISKDLLDAYRKYFRDLETELRNENHELLLNNKYLKPKEGVLLKDPDDVPENIKQEFERTKLRCARQTEQVLDEFSNMNCNEDAVADDIDDYEGSDRDEDVELAKKIINQNLNIYSRIKEEPRDDYEDDAPSDDEAIVDYNVAENIELITKGGPAFACKENDNDEVSDYVPDEDIMEVDADATPKLNSPGPSANPTNQRRPAQPTILDGLINKNGPDGYRFSSHFEVADTLDKLFESMKDEISSHSSGPKVKRLKSPKISKPQPPKSLEHHTQKRKQGQPKQIPLKAPETPKSSKPGSQEDIDILGTIEPADKVIDVIEIDDE